VFIEVNKLEAVHRLHAEISSLFDYAIAHGMVEYNQAELDRVYNA